MIKILLSLLLCSVAYGQANLSLMVYSLDTGLGTKPGWFWWYGDSICPSGMARMSSAVVTATATITLPYAVLPGTYRAYLKIESRDASNGTVTNLIVGLNAGGSTVEAVCNANDADVYWTHLPDITVPTSTSTLTFNWRTIDGTTTLSSKSCSMIGLYLTADTNFILTSDDYVQKWIVPTGTDTDPPIPGNLLHNGSFELGMDGWSLFPNTRLFYSADNALSSDAQDGTRAFSFPTHPITSTLYAGPGIASPSILNLTTPNMLVRANKAHSLSCWAKSLPAGGKVRLIIKPTVPVPSGLGLAAQVVHQSSVFTLTTNYTQYKLENQILADYPQPAQYLVELDFDPTSVAANTQVYVDSVMFNEGTTAATFAPAKDHELGLEQTKNGGSYYIENSETFINFVVSGKAGSTETLTLHYEVFDREFAIIKSGTMTQSFGPGITKINQGMNDLPLGAFRISAWLSNNSESEMYFSRIHMPRTMARNQGFFGNHYEQWWGNPQLAHSRGYSMGRVFSPAARFRWQFVEPTQDAFSYGDTVADIILQETEAMVNLYQVRASWANRQYMTLGTPSGTGFVVGETVTQDPAGIPKNGLVTWVSTPAKITGNAIQFISSDTFNTTQSIQGQSSLTTASVLGITPVTPSVDRYVNYATQFVNHYKDKFFAYEIMNEPNLDGQVKPTSGPHNNFNLYAEMLTETVASVKAIYPPAKLIGMSGINLTNDWTTIWNLLSPTTRANLYATSIHLYEENSFRNEDFYNVSTAAGGPQIWMTEGGTQCFSQYYGCFAPWRNFGLPLLSWRDSEDVIRAWNQSIEVATWGLAECLASGVNRNFYYGYQFTHRYNNDSGAYAVFYSGLDLQEVAKPMDVANSFFIWASDGGTGQPPRPTTPSHTKVYRFIDQAGAPWLVIKNVGIVTSLSPMTRDIITMNSSMPSNVQIYGYNGNQLTMDPAHITYNMLPLYVKGIGGTTLATMTAAVNAATYTINSDTTGPNIVFCEYPKVSVDALHKNRIRIRWLAWDNFYTTRNFFNAVQTRFTLDGGVPSQWDTICFQEYPDGGSILRSPNPKIPSGTHTFMVEARDKAGNTAAKTINVVVE